MKNILIKFAVWILMRTGNSVGRWRITINGNNVKLSNFVVFGGRTGVKINGDYATIRDSRIDNCKTGIRVLSMRDSGLLESKDSEVMG